MFQTYLKFFFYAGVDWTLSSKFFDITNWAYYLGDTKAATTLVKNLVDETRRLGAKIPAVHGMRSRVQDPPKRC